MKKRNRSYIYVIIVVVLLALLPAPRKFLARNLQYLARPATSAISRIAQRSGSIFSGLKEISSLKQQNKILTEKLKKMQVDSTELEELRHENDVLKNQLGFVEQHQENNLVPARIIGREPFGALDKLTIDKGSRDGIKADAAVISNGSLVGKVSQVLENQAQVTLITSKDSIIQAMLQSSRTLGIIRGSLEGVKLENIPQDTVISDREAVVTSGLGGQIAPGILIGWTKGVATTKSDIYKVVDIEIAEDLNKLEFVFVIK